MPNYHINVFYSQEDNGWIADVPDLRYCSAFAATPEHAVAEVQKAIEAWLEVASSEGRPIPAANYRSAPA